MQAGVSLGLAALRAQQRYVQQVSELDPIDLKTLAQFFLLGDPSVQPVRESSATRTPPTTARATSKRAMRETRRANVERTGDLLRAMKPTASEPVKPPRSPSVRQALTQIAREVGARSADAFTAFAVQCAGAETGSKSIARTARSVRATRDVADRYYVLVKTANHLRKDDIGARVAVVAREAQQHIVGYRIYYQR